MPRIPYLDSPSVAPQGAPTVMMPDSIAQAAGSGAAIGQGLQNIGGEIHQYALEEQHKANMVRVEDAVNGLQQQSMQIVDGVRQQKGANAFDPDAFGGQRGQSLDQVALGNFDNAVQRYQDNLANDQQKLMFKQAADRLRLDLYGKVQNHIAEQDQVVKADTFKGTQQVELQNVGQNGWVNGKLDEPTVQLSLNRSFAAIDAFAKDQGWTPDMVAAQKKQMASQLYGTVINSMLQSNAVEAAKTYFQVHQAEMDPAMVSGLKGKIEDVYNSAQAIKAVDQVMSQGGSLEDQDNRLLQLYQGNPEGLKEARMELEQRYRIQKQSEQVAKEDAVGRLWDMYHPTVPGQQALSLAQIKQTPQWQSLQGDERNKLLAEWEQFSKRNENDPYAQAQKFATYWAYASNPDTLRGMTDGQILALTPKMGLQGVQDLLHQKQQLQQPGKVLESNVDINQLKVFAGQAGLNVYGTLSADDQQKLGDLKYRVDQQIESEQQAKGRMLTRAEKDDIIKRNTVQYQVQDPRSWYNPARWFGDPYSEKPAFAFELKPGDKLAVPSDVRQKIIDEAAKFGVSNPTEEQIQNRYFQMLQPSPSANIPLTQRTPLPAYKVKTK